MFFTFSYLFHIQFSQHNVFEVILYLYPTICTASDFFLKVILIYQYQIRQIWRSQSVIKSHLTQYYLCRAQQRMWNLRGKVVILFFSTIILQNRFWFGFCLAFWYAFLWDLFYNGSALPPSPLKTTLTCLSSPK